MSFVRWTVRWGDTVLATGTGPIPAEYGLPQPRVSHGDRALVRNGQLTAEAVLVPRPPRAFIWGVPDLHFVKVLSMCVMTIAALMVLMRERIEELKLERAELAVETDIFTPRQARWAGHAGFSAPSTRHASPIPAKDLARIRGFKGKVANLHRDEAMRLAMSSGILGALGSFRYVGDSASNVFKPGGLGSGIDNQLGGLIGSASVGDAYGAGGLGLSGRGMGGGGTGEGTIGLGSLGTIGHGSGIGSGSGYGSGSGALGLGGLGSRVSGVRLNLADPEQRRVLMRVSSQLRYCTEGFTGTMTAELDLFDDGRVKSVSVSGPDASMQKCVARRLEPLRFPAGEDHVSARWTIE